MIVPFLYIRQTGRMGKGVFTREQLDAGTLVECSPVIVLSAEERILLDKTLLHDYIFEWGPNKDQCCVALGYLSLYNHSIQANCDYEMDYEERTVTITTLRTVAAGEELFINYNGEWNNEGPVWFETA